MARLIFQVCNHPISSPFLSTSYIQARVRARCAGASAAFVAAATASRSKGEKINGKVDGDAESILVHTLTMPVPPRTERSAAF